MEALFLPLWICIVPSFVLSAPNLGCHEVKAAFAARGISQVEDFPTVPIQGKIWHAISQTLQWLSGLFLLVCVYDSGH